MVSNILELLNHLQHHDRYSSVSHSRHHIQAEKADKQEFYSRGDQVTLYGVTRSPAKCNVVCSAV